MPDRASTDPKHKIFLGYAPGVGKTYNLLDEAQRRKARGQDVVIGHVDAYGRKSTEDIGHGLEVIPGRSTEVGGKRYSDMDLPAILARKPELVIVDDLSVANAPGSQFGSRWQDVKYLLENGINVLSTLNVYNLESLNDSVREISGVKVTDTVPDQVLHDADEVEIIDIPVQALMNRLKRGDVFTGGTSPQAIDPIFEEATLSALREMALREAAGTVDEDLVEYRREKRIEKPWAASDRVMICISPTRSSLRLIRRGWRMGQRMRGEVLAVHVDDGSSHGEEAKTVLEADFALCNRLGIETNVLKGELAPSLIKFAQERNVTSVILGHPERSRLQEIFRPSILSELARELRTVDIIVVSTETAPAPEAG